MLFINNISCYVYLLLITITFNQSYYFVKRNLIRNDKFITLNTNLMSKPAQLHKSNIKLMSNKNNISPKRELFFDIISSGINDRYINNNITRILQFIKYAKNEIDLPITIPNNEMFEPCEEYIDNLTNKAWWNKNDFDWVIDLEKQSNM